MSSFRTTVLLAVVLIGLGSLPLTAFAQGRGQGNGRGDVENVDRRDRGEREDDERRDVNERWEVTNRDSERERRGPPFCRNGEGHPVHGRQWLP